MKLTNIRCYHQERSRQTHIDRADHKQFVSSPSCTSTFSPLRITSIQSPDMVVITLKVASSHRGLWSGVRRRDPQSGKIDHNRQHLCSQSVGCWRLASRRDDDVLNKQLLWNIKGREGEESTLKESENWMGWTSPNISGRCPVGWTSCQELVIFFTGRKHYWRTSLSTACRWKCNTLISINWRHFKRIRVQINFLE